MMMFLLAKLMSMLFGLMLKQFRLINAREHIPQREDLTFPVVVVNLLNKKEQAVRVKEL